MKYLRPVTLFRCATAFAVATFASIFARADGRVVDQPNDAVASGTTLRIAITELTSLGGGTITFTGDALTTVNSVNSPTILLGSGAYVLNPDGTVNVSIKSGSKPIFTGNIVDLAVNNMTFTKVAADTQGSVISATSSMLITTPSGVAATGTLIVKENKTTGNGGAFGLVGPGAITLAGNHASILLQSNTSSFGGGVFYINSGGTVALTANTTELYSITDNYAGRDGGVARATQIIFGGNHNNIVIQRNSSNSTGRYGGAFFASGGFTFSATTSGSTLIADNKSADLGGAIYSTGFVTLNPVGGPLVFVGNTQGGAANTPNAIYANTTAPALNLGGTADILFYDPVVSTGTGGINKTGTGRVLFSGSNTWRGAATISNGSLLLNGGAFLDTKQAGKTLTLASGAILGTHLDTGATAASGTIMAETLSLSGILYAGGTSTLIVRGAATLNDITVYADTYSNGLSGITILADTATFIGAGKIDLQSIAASGTFDVLRYDAGIAASGFSGTLFYQGNALDGTSSRMSGTVQISADTKTIQAVINENESNYLSWDGNTSGAWNLATANWKLDATGGITTAVGDYVTFDDSATRKNVTIEGSRLDVSAMVVNSAQDYTFDGSGGVYATGSSISGNIVNSADPTIGKLVKSGSSKLTFTNAGANTFEQGIDWNDGVISITNGAQLGVGTDAALNILNVSSTLQVAGSGSSTLASAVAFAAGASRTLTVDNASQFIDFTGVISGNGSLILSGNGVTALSGVNTFTGNVTLKDGSTLALVQDASLGAAANALVIAGNVRLLATGSFATARAIDIGAHSIEISSTGDNELTLNGASNQLTGTGTVTLTGRLHAGAASVLGANTNWLIASVGNLAITGNQNVKNLHNNGRITFLDATSALTAATLSGSGTISMRVDFANATANHLDISGEATGEHYLDITAIGQAANPATVNIPLVSYASGNAAFTSNEITDGGMNAYYLKTAGNTVGLVADGRSDLGTAVLGTAGVLSVDWHYSFDSLLKRMGEVRATDSNARPKADLWLRGAAYRLNADRSLAGDKFDQSTWNLTLGADFVSELSLSTLYTGVFVTNGRSDRDFDHYGKGSTDTLGAGAYATWLLDYGWFADLVAKADRNKNELDAREASGTTAHGDYTNYTYGLSLEIGKRFVSERIGWIEATVQAAIAQISGKTYDVSNGMSVTLDSATAAQYRLQILAGREFGRWKPYVKIAETRGTTHGGEVTASGAMGEGTYAPDFDGWRFEAGAGIVVRIRKSSQLYFDYEYNKAQKYERPWAINLGFRHNW